MKTIITSRDSENLGHMERQQNSLPRYFFLFRDFECPTFDTQNHEIERNTVGSYTAVIPAA
jgi:hypothetical protein